MHHLRPGGVVVVWETAGAMGRVYQAYACFRGPGAAVHKREARDMFASARRFHASRPLGE